MKITRKSLNVSIEHTIKVGNNGAIEATIEYQAWVYKRADGIVDVDVDFVDVRDVKFLGIDVEGGYEGYKKFKTTMKELGIDVDKLIDEAAAELITDEDMSRLKSMYANVI